MEDIRDPLRAACDEILGRGETPVVVVMDLPGAGVIRHQRDDASLRDFHAAVGASFVAAARGGAWLPVSDERVIGVLPACERLRLFALIGKLERSLPLVAQSYDCELVPEFDSVEYDERTGLAGLVSYVTRPRPREQVA
jgi:hypothetical protein